MAYAAYTMPRGRLKVYLGFASGVGKTFRLLQEAQALKQRGIDVVIGAASPRGHAETAALLSGLEVLPPRAFSYRGVDIDEMDVESALKREPRPQVVIVDDVAHTNVPGSRHNKRHQDVTALLDAGIDVLCALDVAHLESLNDTVTRVAGLRVRDTVPERFLEQADQVVAIDLDVESLRERGNKHDAKQLAALRELCLREVADRLERKAPLEAPAEIAAQKLKSGSKLMVCLSSKPPHARTLLHRGSRLAGRLRTDWYVVYVETAREAPHRIDAAAQKQLQDNIELAKELGAEFVRLRGDDPVETLLGFARSHGVHDLVIGRGRDSLWRMLTRRSFTRRLVEQAVGLDLHIVSFLEDEPDAESAARDGERP